MEASDDGPDDDHRFRLELLKLLLQVAWADDEMHDAEKAALIDLGRRWELPEAERVALERRLEVKAPLPAPNVGLLKARKDEVLTAVRDLVHSDSVLHEDEAAMLAEIEALLA